MQQQCQYADKRHAEKKLVTPTPLPSNCSGCCKLLTVRVTLMVPAVIGAAGTGHRKGGWAITINSSEERSHAMTFMKMDYLVGLIMKGVEAEHQASEEMTLRKAAVRVNEEAERRTEAAEKEAERLGKIVRDLRAQLIRVQRLYGLPNEVCPPRMNGIEAFQKVFGIQLPQSH